MSPAAQNRQAISKQYIDIKPKRIRNEKRTWEYVAITRSGLLNKQETT